jgi:IMP dehydrogenase
MPNIIESHATGFDDWVLLPTAVAPNENGNESSAQNLYDLRVQLSKNISALPWWSSNMTTVTGKDFAIRLASLGGVPVLPQFSPINDRLETISYIWDHTDTSTYLENSAIDSRGRLLVLPAVGFETGIEDARRFMGHGAAGVVFDSDNGYSRGFNDRLGRIADIVHQNDGIVVAGNVGTAEGVQLLFESGADIAKCGIGSGGACSTGNEIGVHVPQMQLLLDIQDVRKEYPQNKILSDGGIRIPRHANIALTLSDGVMMGQIFAGSKESPAEKRVSPDGQIYARYQGSSSLRDRMARNGDAARDVKAKAVEGVSGWVPYQGTLEQILNRYSRALVSAMRYSGGARDLKEYTERATLQRMSAAAKQALEKGALRYFAPDSLSEITDQTVYSRFEPTDPHIESYRM